MLTLENISIIIFIYLILRVICLKKIFCIILAVIIVACSIPFTAIAESIPKEEKSVITEVLNNLSEEEYIYYSDLFYGYSAYLSKSAYLLDYSIQTQQTLNKVYLDYMDSPYFIFSDIKHSLPLVFNAKEYTKMVSDLLGLTSFTYENALDKANQIFAQELMGENILSETYGSESKWVKNLNKFLKVYDTFEKNFNVYGKTEIEIYQETFEYFEGYGAFSSISIIYIEEVEKIVLPKISEITKILSVGADVLEGAKVLMLSLMIEDIRMCIIDEVLNSQQTSSTLYDGMSRLKKQLNVKFASYFYYNYVEKQLINNVSKYVAGKLTSGTFKLIGAIVDVACFVTFDLIFKVPNIDDLTTQAVLTQYSNDFYNVIRDKMSDFSNQFTNEDISDFEALFTAYQAATNAAFKASEKITLSSNIEEFNNIKSKYYLMNIYENYIDNIKEFIKLIPQNNREINKFDKLTIASDSQLCQGSDTVSENNFYCLKNGLICKELEVKAIFTVNDNCILRVEGDTLLDLGKWTQGDGYAETKFINKGKCIIDGNLTIKTYSPVSMTNDGVLEVKGDFVQTGNAGGNMYMSNNNAVFYIGGNLLVGAASRWNITGGKIILNGNGNQLVKNNEYRNICLVFPVLIIEKNNSSKIIFYVDISVETLFNHNQNIFALYNSGSNSTFVDYDGDGIKDNIDLEPTSGNSCRLYFNSEDTQKGIVSLSDIYTVGGTKITVTATPTKKYNFSKWVNSTGTTVSTTAEYTFVAKEDETYTAIFTKRKQLIRTQTQGGRIITPYIAEIDSIVNVKVAENEGYIYIEGSLACNGVPIENGNFIMPDETVILTAEFVSYEEFFEYNIENGGATIVGCKSEYIGDRKLPSTLGGLPVVAIGDYAFSSCDSLKSVTIPNSVTAIGYNAFEVCNTLTDVYFKGTKAKAQKITISSGNEYLTNATWHYEPTTDLNGDAVTDQTDYQYIADIYTGKIKVENKAELCDMNGDGKFDIRDIIAIREIINL